jgi:hypothetical protein
MINRTQKFKNYFEQNIYLWIVGLFITFLAGIFTVLGLLKEDIGNTFTKNYLYCQIMLSVIGAFALIGIGYILIELFSKESKNTNLVSIRVIPIPLTVFEKELLNTSKLRVFASNGESAKSLFLSFDRNKNTLTKNLDVEVLLRAINSDTNRDKQLKDQAARWAKDIDSVLTKDGHNVETNFKLYDSPVMLSGFIFDNRIAMLAWYSRPNDKNRHRSLANPPLIYLSSDDPDSKRLLDDAIRIFDDHYSAGVALVCPIMR